jgi:hypothetical protein
VIEGDFLVSPAFDRTAPITMHFIKIINEIININKQAISSDVWLTVHRNSVWIRKTN